MNHIDSDYLGSLFHTKHHALKLPEVEDRDGVILNHREYFDYICITSAYEDYDHQFHPGTYCS